MGIACSCTAGERTRGSKGAADADAGGAADAGAEGAAAAKKAVDARVGGGARGTRPLSAATWRGEAVDEALSSATLAWAR